MGVFVGIVAFLMTILEDFLFEYKLEWTQELLTEHGFGLSWFVYVVFSMIMVAIAVVMSLYYGPGAIGSGVAETIGVVNGVNYHAFIGVNTLITKALGVVFAVCGGLRIGKEGPLAHIGSVMGVCMIYLPLNFTKKFRNDRDKRNIIACGAGVGVAVAFGAPIGGVLFAYEISKANSFWTF
jgi:chloride channel 7